MHRIHRHWAACRASQLFSPASAPTRSTFSLIHRNVSVKRLPSANHKGSLVSCISKRCFTQSWRAAPPSQAAQPNRTAEDVDLDDTIQDSAAHALNLDPGRDRSALEQSFPEYQPSKKPLKAQRRIEEQIGGVSRDGTGDPTLHEFHLPVDEDEFAASGGFWSLKDFDFVLDPPAQAASIATSGNAQATGEDQLKSKREEMMIPSGPGWRFLWAAQARPSKIDLSRWDPIRGEREGLYSLQPKLNEESGYTNFRENRGQRKLVANFLDKIYCHVSPSNGISDKAADALLHDPVFASVKINADSVIDLLNWSWVVAADPDRRVKRLIALSQLRHDQVTAKVPQWLVLQILRSDRICPQDFADLLDVIEKASEKWWSKVDLMVLTVRLLRHARSTAPTSLNAVIEYFIRTLDFHYLCEAHVHDFRRRTHWCNRILKLLALPTRLNPFIYSMLQQDAQLLLLHHMHDARPAIPITREGYRALTMLQSMHKKTESERAWAHVQADTWPPWEKEHQMGVTSPPRESSGSTSRVNLVLSRMREDGYAPHAFDIAAQILGGRDSDKSPTAQVRRTPQVISIKTPWLPGTDTKHLHISPQVWAARITATRTIREAWMGFCAYESTWDKRKQSNTVYLAMFQKLWAKTISAQPERDLTPGDGIENFPDPELPRDQVHVPEEPPSAEELYTRMRANNIRPSGRLLSQLLQQERNLHRGLAYIDDSTITANQRAILARPMLHSPSYIAEQLRMFHADTVKGYLCLLSRPHVRRKKEPAYTHSYSFGRSTQPFSGPLFALQIMRHARFSDPCILTGYIAGLSNHLYATERSLWRMHIESAWRLLCESYDLVSPKVECSALSHVLFMAWSIQTWTEWPEAGPRYNPLEVSKRFFMAAVTGRKALRGGATIDKKWTAFLRTKRKNLHSVPTADMVQEMAFLIVAAQPKTMAEDVLNLLRWAFEHREQMAPVSNFTRRNLAAFRVYLEGQWATRDSSFVGQDLEFTIADPSLIEEAKTICEELGGWADEEEVERYLVSSAKLFGRVKMRLTQASTRFSFYAEHR